jgi:hypothetical protein
MQRMRRAGKTNSISLHLVDTFLIGLRPAFEVEMTEAVTNFGQQM